MTKSNEPDPRLAKNSDEETTSEKPVDSGTEPDDEPSTAKVDEDQSQNDASVDENEPSNGGDSSPTEKDQRPLPESVPVFSRPKAGERVFEAYSSTRSSQLTGSPERSEATFVAQEPRLYAPPRSGDEDDEETSGNFPQVAADTQRLFIVIELPRALKRELFELSTSFRPREHERVRWMDQEAMHLTLKFLGDTPIDKIDDIKASLERAANSTGKFSIKIGRTGCFPSFRDPRICWVGFSGELRRLEQLQGRVEGGMNGLGFEPEERLFRPHVTIGRTRPGIRGRFAEDIGISWQHAPLRTTGQILPVSAIALYRSYLDERENAKYEQLGNFELQ